MEKGNGLRAEALNEILLPGEEICWYGKPNTFRLFERDAKKGILCKWIGSVLAMVLGGWFCLRTGKTWGDIWLVPVIVLLIAVSPLLERHKLSRCQYWITTQRVILMFADCSSYAMAQADIDDYRIIRGCTAGDCLILGSQIFEEAPKQLRWQACHPRVGSMDSGENMANMGVVLYALNNADAVVQYLHCGKKM